MRNSQDAVMNAIKPQFAQYPMVIAALALLSACDRNQGQSTPAPPDPPVQVRITELSAGPITRSVVLPAQVIALQEATLYAKVSGYLKSIAVDKGDKVAAGATPAPLEKPELPASRGEQQAEVNTGKAEYS